MKNTKNINLENDNTTLEIPPEEGDTNNPGRAEGENLLDRLLYKGVLPRYAFPTDVATFYVFEKDQSSNYRTKFQYTPSQGLTAALSQYAPGKDIWIDGKLWQSGAVYSPINGELFKTWKNRRLYFECSECEHAITEPNDKNKENATIMDCPACNTKNSFGPGKRWLRPPGFAHPIYIDPKTSPEDQPAVSYATRAKLTTPTVDAAEWVQINNRIKLYSSWERLLVTNRGPKNRGYNYCIKCGTIEPTENNESKFKKAHKKPFPAANYESSVCKEEQIARGIVLGTDFPSDILLISLSIDEPINLKPGLTYTKIALRTVCEALSIAATKILDLESGEVQAEFRPALSEGGNSGQKIEIYLYDTLPGGAGFSPKIGEQKIAVFREALKILKYCPDDCDRSCYRCIRSYKNKFEHNFLNRKLGSDLLSYLIENKLPTLSSKRMQNSINRLLEDLRRQNIDKIAIEDNATLKIETLGNVKIPILITCQNGNQLIVSITHPLTPKYLSDEKLSKIADTSRIKLHKIDEILISQNLPQATLEIEQLLKELDL